MSGELPAEILAGAVADSQGTFTVALDKAKDKLKRFQLPDPRHYILQIIQAVVAGGATEIDVTVTGWAGDLMEAVPEGVAPGYRMVLAFDGPGYTRKELAGLFDFIFESQRDRGRDRLREMALGMLSCQALEPSYVRLSSASGFEWVRRSGDDAVVRACLRQKRHTFELRRLGQPTEPELMRDACQALPIRLILNHEVINLSNQLASATPWPAWAFDTGVMKGCIGLPYTTLSESRIYFFRHGVRVSGKNEARLYPPVVVMLDHPGLRKNVSQSDIVEDEVYQKCLSDLQQMLLQFAGNLCKRRIPNYHQTAVQNFLLDLVSEWIPPPLLTAPQEEVPPDLAPLMAMPIFTDRSGMRRSLSDIAPFFKRDGFVSKVSRRYHTAAASPDWLLLHPGKAEEAALRVLFEKVVDVTPYLPAPRSHEDEPPGVEYNREFLVSRTVDEGDRIFVISIEDSYPTGQCCVRLKDRRYNRKHTLRRYLNGWSLCVDGRAYTDNGLVQQQAVDLLVEHAPALYQALFERLTADFATSWGAQPYKRRRSLEHLAAWWIWCFEQAGGPRLPLSGSDVWGPAGWQARIFETRCGPPVSLSDMQRWVDDGHTLVVAYGGSRLKEDYAVDASPQVTRLLRLVFGDSKVLRATLRAPYWEERRAQRLLPGASQRPAQAPAPPAVEAEEDVFETVGIPALEVAAPPAEVEDPPAAAPQAPPPMAEEPAAPPEEPIVFVSVRFHQDAIRGVLQLDSVASPLQVQVGTGEPVHHALFEMPRDVEGTGGWLPVGGQVEAESAPEAWGPREQEVLRGATVALFERLGARMEEVGERDPWFAYMRSLLLRFLLVFKDTLQSRLSAPKLQDRLMNLRFLPLVGGGLASLLTLWTEARHHGYLPVMKYGCEPPILDYPPAEVGDAVPLSFYQALFPRVVEVSESALGGSNQDRLVAIIRRELKRMAARGEALIPEPMLANLQWAALGTAFAMHVPDTGQTFLNPDHRVWRDAARRFESDPALLPVLVSTVYGYLRQALGEPPPYEEEMTFLAALVARAPAEK